MNYLKRFITQYAVPALLLAAPAAALSSCGVMEDLDPCPGGLEMRFVYDHNLESANAFPNQVDCLTLHIYDEEGNFVKTLTETSEALKDENWRLRPDLEPGSYHAVAYGGIACDRASFAHREEPASGSNFTDIAMALKESHVGTRLHDHFHGAVDFTVDARQEGFSQVTVPMTKTTNHFRILLQHLDNRPVNGDDFEFLIEDRNGVLDHRNRPASRDMVTYRAWETGSAIPDEGVRAEEQPVQLGYGELSTSRVMLGSGACLVIRLKETGGEVVRLPLPSTLALSKSSADPWSDQEYLDRCSRWNMTFFLDHNNNWVKTHIIINDWVVRINDHDF